MVIWTKTIIRQIRVYASSIWKIIPKLLRNRDRLLKSSSFVITHIIVILSNIVLNGSALYPRSSACRILSVHFFRLRLYLLQRQPVNFKKSFRNDLLLSHFNLQMPYIPIEIFKLLVCASAFFSLSFF